MQKQVDMDLIMQNSQLYVKSVALFIAGTIQYNTIFRRSFAR